MGVALATSSSDNPPPSVPDDLEDDFDVSMRSYRSGPKSPPLASLGSVDSPHNAQTAQLRSRSSSLLRSEQMTHDLLSPRSQSSSGPQHNSDSWPVSSSLSQYMQYMGSSGGGSLNPESLPVPAPRFTESSEEVDPYLHTMSASADVDFFGQDLANLSISGAFKPSCPPLHTGDPSTYDFSHSNGDGDPLDDDPYDDYNRGEGGPPGGGNPGDPDGQDGVEVDQPQIQVPPDDAGGIPRDPGDDNESLEIPVFEERPTLCNIYLHMWALYAFSGVTQEVVQVVLESHQSASESEPSGSLSSEPSVPSSLEPDSQATANIWRLQAQLPPTSYWRPKHI
ncbi:hypothetical protein RSAG8_09199, partial [Rhizoctonia solani AG-8 WAC10335]